MKTLQFIGDNTFCQGFYLQAVDRSQGRVLDFGLPNREKYAWKIAQHFSRYDLTETGTFFVREDGARVYENPGKRVTLLREEDETWVISLETICSAEYTHPRVWGEPWPHLLIEQDMTSEYLDRYDSLPFTISLKNEYLRDCMGEEYDPVLHCYQTSLFFVVKNQNPASPGFGDFIWFGVPGYDSRVPYKELYIAEDGGKDDASKKLIYCLGGQDWYATHYDRNPKSGQWATVQADLLPFIREMVDVAHQRGYLKNTFFSDLQFNSMNLGAEVTGTFDGAMSIKNMSLLGVISQS